jgi:hypothetical protein
MESSAAMSRLSAALYIGLLSSPSVAITTLMNKSIASPPDLPLRCDSRSELEEAVIKLREQGMTFKAAGAALGITASRVRHLYLRACKRKAGNKPLWTDGLNRRLAKSLRWLEFSNREEVAEAFRSGHMHRLAASEHGISAAALVELEQWLAGENSPGKPPACRQARGGDGMSMAPDQG